MLKNYLIVAWRNLTRHKLYSAINVFGLAIGIAFCTLSFLFVRHEWGYDDFHADADRIYRVYSRNTSPKGVEFQVRTPTPLAPALLETYPEISRAVRFRHWVPVVVQCGDKLLQEEELVFADPEVFEVFSFPAVAGDLHSALDGKGKVVLTREMAMKYFGRDNPVGEQLVIRGRELDGEFTVTGVVDVPSNSSIRFNFLVSFQYLLDTDSATMWNSSGTITYVMLAKGARAEDLERRFPSFVDEHFTITLRANSEVHGEFSMQLELQPLREGHLAADFPFALGPVSDPAYSFILGGIALAVLLIACVNFTNLSLGLASTRFKEVGVRKMLGSTRQQLLKQFCGEAMLLNLVALLIGLALAEMALPAFGSLVDKELSAEFDLTWVALVGMVLVAGLAAGVYPALSLSRPQPAEVLRGKQKLSGVNWFSRGLIMVQFALSAGLMVLALVMAEQMEYLVTKNLGFNREQVVVVRTGFDVRPEERSRLLTTYQGLASQREAVLNVAAADASFSGDWGNSNLNVYEGRPFEFFVIQADAHLPEALGMELVAGRNFVEGSVMDLQEAAIVNETLVRSLGWGDPLGKTVPTWKRTIIGVIKDFHMQSLHREVKPVVLECVPDANPQLRFIFAKIRPGTIPVALELLRGAWQHVLPDHPFVYSFLDEDVERQYRSEERWTRIIRYAALFAVFVACLGIFGLSSLAVARRTKEIGIRKVLGASVPSIVGLLGKEFTYLVLAANVIAWPVAYFAMSHWLENFAYRIELGPGVFVLGGVLALGIAWLTVSYQAIRAARANPVEALRYE